MQNTFYELAMWQERWCMENLPPLPLTTWVSPHYDPYEIDHTHYSNSNSNSNYDYDSNYDSNSNSSYTQTQYIEQYEPEYNHYYDTETDDDESLY